MSLPGFLRFRPVPVRARHDGWTPFLQFRFILSLARGMGPAEAARHVGRSRQTAYALRDKPGGKAFAAAWDAAIAFAAGVRAAAGAPRFLPGGIETVWTPRYYRGRLVGFVQREDIAGALRRQAELDRIVERIGMFDGDQPDFEELLDIIEPGRRSETVEADAMGARSVSLRQFSSSAEHRPSPFAGLARTARVVRNE